MSYELDTGTALVCSAISRDVLKVKLDVDEDGIIENLHYNFIGSSELQRIVKRLDIILGLGVEDATSLEWDSFTDNDKSVHIGIMMVNAIRSAVINYVTKIQKESTEEEVQAKVLL